MNLLDYVDRIAIIHLRSRTDRLEALVAELRRMGIEISHPKVVIPDAPMPADPNGFPSKGIYGNFLSHLQILKSALQDGMSSVWILEDDAIFSRRFMRDQEKLSNILAHNKWDICFFGHTLTRELASLEHGLPRYSGPFYWAHCYAVHAGILPRLIGYFEETIDNPAGDPRGGKMYIDAAHTLFRKFNPDVVTLVANPLLSAQRGSPSNLSKHRWYDTNILSHAVGLARELRDEYWRWTGRSFGGAAPPHKID